MDRRAAAEIENCRMGWETRHQIVQELKPRVATNLINPGQMARRDEVVASFDDALPLRCHKLDGSWPARFVTQPPVEPAGTWATAARLTASAGNGQR